MQAYITTLQKGGKPSTPTMEGKNKALDAMHKIRFLENYTGILVHNHETSLYHFGTDHAECNVHIIRYLRKNNED